jgi:hypothetical protein
MFMPVLIAILISASPSDADSATPAPVEPLKVSVGNVSFSGSTIELTKPGNETFECEIEGDAHFALGSDGDTDIAVTAQKMVISRNARSEITIRCIGACKLTDTELACSADRMQIQFTDQFQLKMTGRCRVESGAGDNRTSLAGESITFQGGTFNASRAASFKRAQ